MGKTTKSRSQRRPLPGVTVQSPDADQRPFGAMIHMDHIQWSAVLKLLKLRATA